jgi:phage tail sheath gpL-like
MSKLISRTLTAFALAGFLVVPFANAATTGSVTLAGTVDSTLVIVASDTTDASDLDLSTGEKIVLVSELAISTNNDQGFTLTATDDGAGLTKTGGATISFKVKTVVAGATAPISAAFTDAVGAPTSFGSTAAGSKNGDLYIKYNPAASQDPGQYDGSIGLTVSDN